VLDALQGVLELRDVDGFGAVPVLDTSMDRDLGVGEVVVVRVEDGGGREDAGEEAGEGRLAAGGGAGESNEEGWSGRR